MQMSVPEALDLDAETAETQQLYGIDNETTAVYGRRLLAARRLAERGVRFTLVYLSDYGEWDSHQKLKRTTRGAASGSTSRSRACSKDLKRRGMWDDTLVVCCTEFGRTPGVEGGGLSTRPHRPRPSSARLHRLLRRRGIKGGIVHGATDELGFHAVEHPHYVTDIHATVLHLLGLDARQPRNPRPQAAGDRSRAGDSGDSGVGLQWRMQTRID